MEGLTLPNPDENTVITFTVGKFITFSVTIYYIYGWLSYCI